MITVTSNLRFAVSRAFFRKTVESNFEGRKDAECARISGGMASSNVFPLIGILDAIVPSDTTFFLSPFKIHETFYAENFRKGKIISH